MKRVVYDTNVYISALIFPGGKPDQVLGLALNGLVELHISPFILTELRRVLRGKFGVSAAEAGAVVAWLWEVAAVVEPRMKICAIQEKEDDNRIVECAVEAKAHHLGSTMPSRTSGRTEVE